MADIKQSPVEIALAAFRADVKLAPPTLRARIAAAAVDRKLYRLGDLKIGKNDINRSFADGHRVSDGSIPIVARGAPAPGHAPNGTMAEWDCELEKLAPHIGGVAGPNLVLCGRMMCELLYGITPACLTFNIIGLKNAQDVEACINAAAARLAKNIGGSAASAMTVYREAHRVVFAFPNHKPVYIEHHGYETVEGFLQTKISCDAIAYNGSNVVFSALGKLSHEHLLNIIDIPQRETKRYDELIAGSFTLGFGFDLAISGLDVDAVGAAAARSDGTVKLGSLSLEGVAVHGAVVTVTRVQSHLGPCSEYEYGVETDSAEVYNLIHCAEPIQPAAIAKWTPGLNVCKIPLQISTDVIKRHMIKITNANALNLSDLKVLLGAEAAQFLAIKIVTGAVIDIDAIVAARLKLAQGVNVPPITPWGPSEPDALTPTQWLAVSS